MNKTITSVLICLLLTSLVSCVKETTTAIKADFEISIKNEDYSVPVKIDIQNHTTGADTYEWTFEGAVKTTSSDQNPPTLTYVVPGIYKIILKATNKDGAHDEKTMDIQIDSAMKAAFDWHMIGSDFSPVTLQLKNYSQGATQYTWNFTNANIAFSTEKEPVVIFCSPGEQTLKLTIFNGKESYSMEKTITVLPALHTDFDWSVDFIDEDYEAPVSLFLHNQSISATNYEWTITGANPSTSTEVNPTINFSNAGTYNITLKATNDKESKTLQKKIIIKPNLNLLTLNNMRFGINTAHASIGCFFSSVLGKVLTSEQINEKNGVLIDIAFLGWGASFSLNQFLTPDEVASSILSTTIPNAIHTKILNQQELDIVNDIQLTESQFDAISDGNIGFQNITIADNEQTLKPFDNSVLPRIVLFQTHDGRKGAIKITQFVQKGKESYIIADIKIQKIP